MDSSDDRGHEFRSDLADLRQVPLAELHNLGDGALDQALRRVAPEDLRVSVPVAAFNSAI
jgi:FXSXX-COOH protein